MPLFYAFLLLLAFYLLLIVEFFLPTGGLAGFAAVAALVATLAIAFSHSMTAGAVMLIVFVLTTPAMLGGLIRWWPHTPIGRRMLNRAPGEMASIGPPRTTSRGQRFDALVGRMGTAKSNLLPSGLVTIDGEKIDAVSIGMPIDAGSPIIVTAVVAGRVQVRPATDEDRLEPTPAVPQSPPSLEQSLDSFDVE